MLAYLIHKVRGDLVESFLKWLVLHQLDDMFCGASAPNFIRLQREEVMEFLQQGHCLLSELRQPFFQAIQPAVLTKDGEEEVLPLLR